MTLQGESAWPGAEIHRRPGIDHHYLVTSVACTERGAKVAPRSVIPPARDVIELAPEGMALLQVDVEAAPVSLVSQMPRALHLILATYQPWTGT
jgi:hypothetical protein